MAEAIVSVKTCSACKQTFSIDAFANCKNNKDGKRGWCRPCAKAYGAEWHVANGDRMRALMRARQEIKRDEDNAKKRAWYVANKELTRQRSAQYRAENKDKIAARDAQYRARVAEQLRIKKAAYYAKNKDRAKARMAAWHAENPDAIAKYRSKNRERMNATSKAWRNSHPEAGRIYKQNRRARKRENGGALSVGIVEKLFRLQRGKCACCKKPLGNGYHLDHIIPLKLGGKNIDENVQLLTRLCNMQKHAKDPVDFMQERGFLF